MSTIANLLRAVAQAMLAPYPEHGVPPSPRDLAQLIKKAADELEAAPAAGAVQPLGDLPEHVCGSTGFGLGADDVCAACQWWRRKWDLENKTVPYADHLSAIDHWKRRALAAEARQVTLEAVRTEIEAIRDFLRIRFL